MRLPTVPRGMSATRIDRYILRQLLLALVGVTTALVALIWLTSSLRYVELVVNRGLSFRVFVQLTALLVPNFIAVILPVTTFVVVQFVYQRMAGDRELTVMRAAGLSPAALARPALVLALAATLFGYVLTVWVVPSSSGRFREYLFEIRSRVAAFLLQEGVFTPISDDLTVYVRSRDADGTLHGILVDDGRNPASHATILAESGRLISDAATPRVLLINGSREEIDRQTGRLRVVVFADYVMELSDTERGDEQRFRDPTELSLHELLYPAPGSYFQRDLGKLQVEAHRRLSAPLTTLSFTLVALVSVLQGMFRRHGGLLRPFMAIMVVVGLVAAGLAIANLAAREPALMPLVWVHALAPALIGAGVLFGPELRQMLPAGLQARLGAG